MLSTCTCVSIGGGVVIAQRCMAYIIIYIGCDIVYVLVMPYIILYIIKIVNITVIIFSILEAKFDLFQAPI